MIATEALTPKSKSEAEESALCAVNPETGEVSPATKRTASLFEQKVMMDRKRAGLI